MGCIGKNKHKKDLLKLCVNKEFRNFKFFQFYDTFSVYYKKVFDIFTKSRRNFKKNDKMELVKLLNLLKEFHKMKISDIRGFMNKSKKKMNKFDEKVQNEFLSNLFFNFEEDLEKKENLRHLELKPINFKNNKRGVSLIEKNKYEPEEEKESEELPAKQNQSSSKEFTNPITKFNTSLKRKSSNNLQQKKKSISLKNY